VISGYEDVGAYLSTSRIREELVKAGLKRLNPTRATHSNVTGENVLDIKLRGHHRGKGWHEVIGSRIARGEDSAHLRKFNTGVLKGIASCVTSERYEVLARAHAM
jgi:hypothetical protein